MNFSNETFTRSQTLREYFGHYQSTVAKRDLKENMNWKAPSVDDVERLVFPYLLMQSWNSVHLEPFTVIFQHRKNPGSNSPSNGFTGNVTRGVTKFRSRSF